MITRAVKTLPGENENSPGLEMAVRDSDGATLIRTGGGSWFAVTGEHCRAEIIRGLYPPDPEKVMTTMLPAEPP